MNLFINDKPVKIVSLEKEIQKEKYTVRLTGRDEIVSRNLNGNVLIEDASSAHIDRLFKLLEIKKLKKLETITLTVKDKRLTTEFIKDQFKIVKASGGIVLKEDKVLLIFRLGKWDLPKGKLKKGEAPSIGAKREVEEECNVSVLVKEKLCATWHTYIRKGRRVLKKTNWYVMDCISDADMKPQRDEGIEEVKWADKKDIRSHLENSYKSIENVFEKFYKETAF